MVSPLAHLFNLEFYFCTCVRVIEFDRLMDFEIDFLSFFSFFIFMYLRNIDQSGGKFLTNISNKKRENTVKHEVIFSYLSLSFAHPPVSQITSNNRDLGRNLWRISGISRWCRFRPPSFSPNFAANFSSRHISKYTLITLNGK